MNKNTPVRLTDTVYCEYQMILVPLTEYEISKFNMFIPESIAKRIEVIRYLESRHSPYVMAGVNVVARPDFINDWLTYSLDELLSTIYKRAATKRFSPVNRPRIHLVQIDLSLTKINLVIRITHGAKTCIDRHFYKGT